MRSQLYGVSYFHNRRDKTAKRGAIMKAMLLFSTRPFFSFCTPPRRLSSQRHRDRPTPTARPRAHRHTDASGDPEGCGTARIQTSPPAAADAAAPHRTDLNLLRAALLHHLDTGDMEVLKILVTKVNDLYESNHATTDSALRCARSVGSGAARRPSRAYGRTVTVVTAIPCSRPHRNGCNGHPVQRPPHRTRAARCAAILVPVAQTSLVSFCRRSDVIVAAFVTAIPQQSPSLTSL